MRLDWRYPLYTKEFCKKGLWNSRFIWHNAAVKLEKKKDRKKYGLENFLPIMEKKEKGVKRRRGGGEIRSFPKVGKLCCIAFKNPAHGFGLS